EPMHVFDAEKVVGKIIVRDSVKDEKIELLDGKIVSLPEGTLLICDEEGPLAIAGIKGGKKAEVGAHTRSIIIEAANFDSTAVRKTSTKIGIKTDSSKRFENNVSAQKAIEAIKYYLTLLKKEDKEISVSAINDQNFSTEAEKMIEVPFEKIKEKLGADISNGEIIECLNRVGLISEMAGDKVLIRVPVERKDINVAEDITEEVGRIYGYDKLPVKLPLIKSLYSVNKNISVQARIKNFLVSKGFSEMITYSLSEKGERKLANPLALDKGYLRTNLSDSIEEKLAFNLYSSDLLNTNEIRIFEIGKVFKKDTENFSLAIGIAYKKAKGKTRPNDEIKIVRDELFAALNLNLNTVCTIDDSGGLIMAGNKQVGIINNKDGILEIDLDLIIDLVNENEDVFLETKSKLEKYQPFSIYPFIVRDIALFVPGENKEEEILKIIKIQAGELLMKENLFDVFTKTDENGEKKTSYAFRLIFQSFHKTLTEKEIEEIMYRITFALNSQEDWKVR
ncbi:MAG: phenylalanine--tRNA ligase beta subunit-related protein, partial [Candidatus Paceibacterota bacterium]